VVRANQKKEIKEVELYGRKDSVEIVSRHQFGISIITLSYELEKYATSKGARCLNSKCYRQSEAGSVYPYSAFIQFIRQFSEEASVQLFYRVCGTRVNKIIRLVPELADSLPADSNSPSIAFSEEQPQQSPEAVQREELYLLQSVTEFFFSLAKEKPLLLFIDDWQWSGQSSLKLLQFMRSRNLTQYPVLVVCAYRDTDIGELSEDVQPWISDFIGNLQSERTLKLVHLERFDLSHVSDLIQKVFSKEREKDEFLNLIYSRTGGNPFFIEEVLNSLVEDRKIFRDSEGKWQRKEISEITIPHSISAVVKLRLTRLGAETLGTLSAASVLGENFDFQILAKVLRANTIESLRTQMDKALRSGLIRAKQSSQINSFCDEAVRDLLYEEMSLQQRANYHHEAALALEEYFRSKGNDMINERASELAHHFYLSGNKEKALEYYILAGRKASELYAHNSACSNFISALGLIAEQSQIKENSDLLLQADLLYSLGLEAQFVPSEFQNVTDYLEESAAIYEKIGQKRRAADIHLTLGKIYFLMMFELAKSQQSNSKALLLLEGDKEADSELARAYVWGAIEDVWRGDRDAVLDKSRRALEICERVEAYDAFVIAKTNLTGISTFDEFESVMESNNYALKVALEHNLVTEAAICYFHKAVTFVNMRGASKLALDLFLESLDYSTKTGEFMIALFNKTELAYEIYLPLGEWRRAEELTEDIKRSVQNLPPGSFFGILADSVSGQVLLSKGELEEAEKCLRRVESKTKGLGIFQIDVPLYTSLSRLYMNKGEYEKAQNYLSEGYRRSKKRGPVIFNCVPHVQLLSLMIEFALRQGDKPATTSAFNEDALFQELSETCKQINEEWAVAYLQKTQGLIEHHKGELKLAEQSLQKSLDGWKRLGWRYEFALTLTLLGEVYQNEDKILGAANSYKESLQVLEELGAQIEIQRARNSKEECERLINSARLENTPIEILSDEKGQIVFENLVKAFIQDYIVNKIPVEKCGWRSLRVIERETGVPGSVLYAKTGGVGSLLRQLLGSKLVESAIFSGERGRGGEITKVRVAYLANTAAKEFVDKELRNKMH
jgi:tetratricopeptide (TPR) repeat protein